MSSYCKIFLFLSIFSLSVNSQTGTIKHRILKGETVYRISLKYNVSIADIYELNPESKYIIKAGEILLIPQKKSSEKTVVKKSPDDYVVTRGETKFGISKAYGISISELERANPFIKKGLQAGHILQIPIKTVSNNKSSGTRKTTSDLPSNKHIVSKGETLWGISQKYNMKLDDLIALNEENLGRFLQIGQILLVEGNDLSKSSETYTVKKGDTKYELSKKFNLSIAELERLNPQIVDLLRTGTVIKLNDYEDDLAMSDKDMKSDTANFESKTDVTSDYYVIKPKETLYSISKKAGITIDELLALNPKLNESVLAGDSIRLRSPLTKNTTEESVDKINPKMKTNIIWSNSLFDNNLNEQQKVNDFYNGLIRAVNDSKTKYSNIVFELKDDEQKLNEKLIETNLSTYNLKPIPDFNYEDDISKLSTLTLNYKNANQTETLSIKALPSIEDMRDKMLEYLKSKNGKVICLYGKTFSSNIESIEKVLPNVELIKLNRNGNFKLKDLEDTLDPDRKNYVIIESFRTGVFLNSTSFLLRKSSEFDIQLVVLNAENIPDSSTISYNRFKILNLIYPLPFNPNYLKDNSSHHQIAYLIISDIFQRLNNSGVSSFKNRTSTTSFGTTFTYTFKDKLAENKAVSIYMFNDKSNMSLVGTY
ncbi:hypothetical protein CA834_11100 [Winogradskyella aurantia]|uniref:LysM domain-containing protein n=1 Tax=Winogradskyella aurantia TaxID=1915063 RepID=A0A265UQ94_9FLAO|nr:hypothetical protein CA834_11100 [Winogradskyella aurantia]